MDANTRIQIIDTMMLLPHADREQNAAFIRDERVLVVWTEDPANIVSTVNDFEERLIRLLWRTTTRPGISSLSSKSGHGGLYPDSASGHQSVIGSSASGHGFASPRIIGRDEPFTPGDVEKGLAPTTKTVTKRTWYGGKKTVTVEIPVGENAEDVGAIDPSKRPALLYAPVYNGIAAALSMGMYLCFVSRCIFVLMSICQFTSATVSRSC